MYFSEFVLLYLIKNYSINHYYIFSWNFARYW